VRIAHVDLDSFYVSAERLKNPSLIGIPMAVGGAHGRGVISSASYEARKFGVRSAMPVQQARKLCPELKLVHPDFEHYSALSIKVFQILERITPVVDPVSIDEAYLDLTGVQTLWKSAYSAGEVIRRRVLEETGLTVTVAIASSRTVAKIATDRAKPNGLIEILQGDEAAFLSHLPVSVIPGVGPKLLERLNEIQVFRIKDLNEMGIGFLESTLGSDASYLKAVAEGKGSTQFFSRSQIAECFSRKNLYEKFRIRSRATRGLE